MRRIVALILMFVLTFALAACANNESVKAEDKASEVTANTEAEADANTEDRVVNLYTDRHYDTDQALYDKFKEQTGITVNVVKAGSDELLEKLSTEGEDTEADLLITADVGRLYKAGVMELSKPFESTVIEANVPENMRADDNSWTALTVRARVIVYDNSTFDPSRLSTYEALAAPEWAGKVLVRSSSHVYNQSLLASFIELNGSEQAKLWAEGMVKNFARSPEGNDRDQMKAVVAGEGEVAIVNTYYVGKLLNSSEASEVEVGERIGVFFPNQETTGAHINISGAALTKHGKNSEEATLLMEFLTGEEAQYDYANANYEYPVNPLVEPSDLLKSFGEFKAQEIHLSKLGEHNEEAVKIFNMVGWQ